MRSPHDLAVALLETERRTRKLRDVATLERRLQRHLKATWKRQRRAVLAALARRAGEFPTVQEAVEPTDLGRAVDVAVLTDPALVTVLQVVAEQAVEAGIVSAHLDLEVDATFALTHPAAVKYLSQYGAQRVAGIDDVTRRYLRTVVTQAADEGWSYQRTAQAITSRFAEFAVGAPQEHIRSRAELVAVTEVGDAYEQGASMVADELGAQGMTLEKQWLAEDDPCPECAENADAGWIGAEESFPSGDDEPTAHPACKCSNEWRVDPTTLDESRRST